jgi:hypothetical protein
MLALGAMALLMVGVFSGEKSVTMVNGLAVALLIAAGLVLVLVTIMVKPTMAPSCPIRSPVHEGAGR